MNTNHCWVFCLQQHNSMDFQYLMGIICGFCSFCLLDINEKAPFSDKDQTANTWQVYIRLIGILLLGPYQENIHRIIYFFIFLLMTVSCLTLNIWCCFECEQFFSNADFMELSSSFQLYRNIQNISSCRIFRSRIFL